MDAAEAITSVASSSELLARSTASLKATEPAHMSTFGLLGWVILAVLRVIPGILYWVITFTTITLPTWLFTLFSTTLTFTMNFTTL
jgi:lysophospholipid hydrolase